MKHRFDTGASGLTYGLLVGLISITALVSIQTIGDDNNALMDRVATTLEDARTGSVANSSDGSGESATPTPTPEITYSFTSFTFTTCGQSGSTGPSLSQCQTAYAGQPFASDTGLFTVSAGIQLWTVPETATYRIRAEGAEGSSPNGSNGGEGGIAEGDIALTQGEVLAIVVGQAGSQPDGGFNGGGNGTGTSGSSGIDSTHGGGGASDVRRSGTNLSNRIIVAGGGGGSAQAYQSTGTGGDGGAASGEQGGIFNAFSNAGGGTQSTGGVGNTGPGSNIGSPGTLGVGGDAYNSSGSGGAGAGGGGYYGGGGSGHGGGGGGGSNYVGGVSNTQDNRGGSTSDGEITITKLP
ncbi:MAG: hypothetical protein Alpg2KO_04140 [Alphaproteobacteria bacterium]